MKVKIGNSIPEVKEWPTNERSHPSMNLSSNANKLCWITVPPKLNPFHSSILSLNVGDRASITCSVIKGDIPLTITWKKDGRAIDPSQRMSVTQVDQYNSILVIENLSADHTGNYSCVVRNTASETEGSQALLVNGNQAVQMSNLLTCVFFFSFLFPFPLNSTTHYYHCTTTYHHRYFVYLVKKL